MTIQVARLHGTKDIRLHDEPAPTPVSGETLVRVGAVGLCGSDLHWFDEGSIGDAVLDHPLVLGHEFAGVIAEGPCSGSLVAVEPAVSCGECEYCEQGNPNFCLHTRFSGHGKQDGALRQFMAWPEKCLFFLPPGFTPEQGAMLEPLGVALHSTDLAKLRLGMDVGVFGVGPIGLLVQQLAALSGARAIYTTDILDHRAEASAAMGAFAINDADGSAAARILEATENRGLDVAFEVAGDDGAVTAAVEALRPGGKLILVGIPASDTTTFIASVARRKGLTIKLVRRMKHTYPRAISLVQQGKVDVDSLVTHRFPLEQAAQAFEVAARREGLKTMIVMQ